MELEKCKLDNTFPVWYDYFYEGELYTPILDRRRDKYEIMLDSDSDSDSETSDLDTANDMNLTAGAA